MLPRKLFSNQKDWLRENQGEIISRLEQIGIQIDTSQPNDCTSYIICRERKTLTIKVSEYPF